MRSRTKDIVPYSAYGFYAREDMRKPSQDPRNDENDQVDLSETLEDSLELLVLANK